MTLKTLGLAVVSCFLYGGSMFLTSSAFVDTCLTPKWYACIWGSLALILIGTCLSLFSIKVSFRAIIPVLFGVIAGLCTMQALYGILQYAHIFPSTTGFRISGSFDNPAGFAASLCAGFPCLFFFLFQKPVWKKILSIAASIIITATIVLSTSRSGIISLFVVCLLVAFYKIHLKTKTQILVLSASFVIALSGLYFLKKDSANGRLLIWRCTYEMIKDKPITGFGYRGVKAHYMDYQADYFEQYPDSKYNMLAGNISGPFNEYLLILANYGVLGFLVFLAFVCFLVKSFLRNQNKTLPDWIAMWCLLSIAVFSCFSYPLSYPFVWIMGILSILIIVVRAEYRLKLPSSLIRCFQICLIPALLFVGLKTYRYMRAEMLWHEVAQQSLNGKTKQLLPAYERLHKILKYKEVFLYNYAAELNFSGDYDKSLEIVNECKQLWADYDLQMLTADNYRQLQNCPKAEEAYKRASNMFPVKFTPLYRLYQLYETKGDTEKMSAIARVLLEKPVKVMSPAIQEIQNEVKP